MNIPKILVTLMCFYLLPYAFAEHVRTGLDNINEYEDFFQNKKVGIIANHTAYDSKNRFIYNVFQQMENVEVTALFGPEHGFDGVVEAGEKIEGIQHTETGIPIYSLYGKTRKPTAEMLEDIDILIFDIQDIGCRFYTYISTMALAMDAAAECNKSFVVLDRPNPIRADIIEGNILDPAFSTFVGIHPIAVRHGMTIGEIAKMFNNNQWLSCGKKVNLTIIKMTGYKRSMWYEETGLKFINPSPNMISIDEAAMYPGMCLFEGTNLSEARGTNQPLMMFGAPWIDAKIITAKLNNTKIPGIIFEEAEFTPEFSKFANQKCYGSKITVTNRNNIRPFESGIKMIAVISVEYPDKFQWKIEHFDRLCGTDKIRKAIIGKSLPKSLNNQWLVELSEFKKVRSEYLIY
ncbi:MAG: exo-beta-N-acetylmuramidase NamZ domain-containing protein [Sedimentisphaeraceae bacterium JB056]